MLAVKGDFFAVGFDDDVFFAGEAAGDVAFFDFFGDGGAGFEADGEVVGDVDGASRDDTDVLKVAFFEDGDGSSGGAEVDDGDTVFFLTFVEDSAGAGDNRGNEALGGDFGAFEGFAEVVTVGLEGGDDVGAHFEASTCHAERVADSFATVDGVAEGNDVEDFAVGRDAAGDGDVFDAVEVVFVDFVFEGADGNHAFGFGGEKLRAVDGDDGGVDFVARHTLDFTEHAVDGVGGAGEVGENAFSHAHVFSFVVANDGKFAGFID